MKIKYFEYITIYLSVFLACLFIGYSGREYFIKKGADDFTVNLIFGVSVGFGILIFAILSLFLDPIVRWILRRFSKDTKSELFEKQEINPKDTTEINPSEYVGILEENNIDTNAIRIIQYQKKVQQENEKLQIALNYTRSQFALYISDEDLDLLCDVIISYSKKEKASNSKLIETTGLSNLDLYHFGWNIWNHFRPIKQEEISKLLKTVFVSLDDIDLDSIKSHLKDEPQKGTIKIQEVLKYYQKT